MTQSITATELALWPLVHGIGILLHLPLSAQINLIKTKGLLAPNSNRAQSNSSELYDPVLGWNNVVFLSPVRFRGGYGYGSFVVVDPAILWQPGVRCSLYDLSDEVQKAVKDILVFPGTDPVCRLELEKLRKIVAEHRKQVEEGANGVNDLGELRDAWIIQKTEECVAKPREFKECDGRAKLDRFLA